MDDTFIVQHAVLHLASASLEDIGNNELTGQRLAYASTRMMSVTTKR